MKITDIRVRLIDKEDTKLKAVASVTFDESIVVHDIKIVQGKEGYFIFRYEFGGERILGRRAYRKPL